MKRRFTEEELEDRIYATFFSSIPKEEKDSDYSDEEEEVKDSEYARILGFETGGKGRLGSKLYRLAQDTATGIQKGITSLKAGAKEARKENEADERREEALGKHIGKQMDYDAIRDKKPLGHKQKHHAYQNSLEGRDNQVLDMDIAAIRTKGKRIGGAVGAVGLGAVGAGTGAAVGSLINKDLKKELKELKALDKPTENQLRRIKALEAKIKKNAVIATIAGAGVGAVAGGIAGSKIGGSKYKKSAKNKIRQKQDANINSFNQRYSKYVS